MRIHQHKFPSSDNQKEFSEMWLNLSASAWLLIQRSESCLGEALELWQPLHDPEPERADHNFKLDGKEYNYKAADTYEVRTDLEGGILTHYPLNPLIEPEKGQRQDQETMTTTTRDQVFVSYCHRDKEWLVKLQTVLTPLVRKQKIDVWSDERIKTGKKWKQEIAAALNRAKVAVLLVSQNFLASDFIADEEIPHILAAAENDGLTVVWIPITACLVEETDINCYQAAQDPTARLDGLSDSELNRALADVARTIRDAATTR